MFYVCPNYRQGYGPGVLVAVAVGLGVLVGVAVGPGVVRLTVNV